MFSKNKKNKKLCLGIEFWKMIFVLKKKKTCLVELIKKFFRTSKTKNMFKSFFFSINKMFSLSNLIL